MHSLQIPCKYVCLSCLAVCLLFYLSHLTRFYFTHFCIYPNAVRLQGVQIMRLGRILFALITFSPLRLCLSCGQLN